jgi:hypothetical protein
VCLRHIIFSAPTTAVALPVHDAVAVTQDNADWAKEAMLRAWFELANSGGGVARSRAKVDYPVTSY